MKSIVMFIYVLTSWRLSLKSFFLSSENGTSNGSVSDIGF